MRFILSLLPLATIACGPTYVEAPVQLDAADAARFGADTEDAALAVHAANQLSLEALDAELDRRAANNIVASRPFLNLEALDAVSYVGASALDDLAALGRDAFGTVPFGLQTIPQGTLILWAANELDHGTLDDTVGLDRRAADGIVAARPFATIEDLDAVGYVGPSALADLKAYSASFFGTSCSAGTLVRSDGRVFTDLAAAFNDAPTEDVLACAGTFYGEAAWFEGDHHNVALYGFGAESTIFDGFDQDAFIVGLADHSTYTVFGATFRNSNEGWFSAISSSEEFTTIELLAVSMHHNTAEKGGAVYSLDAVVAIDSHFEDNVASWYGGAIAGRSGTFIDSSFQHNAAGDQAAAIRMWHDLTMLGGSVQRHYEVAAVSAFTSNEAGTWATIEGVDFGEQADANSTDFEQYGDYQQNLDLDSDAWMSCNGTWCSVD